MNPQTFRWNLHYLSEYSSSHSWIKERLQKTNEPGLVVQVHKQTQGRGRLDRRWESPKGNLALSVTVPIPEKPETTYQLNIITGWTVVEVLKNYQLPKVQFKWPNDVLVDGKKICGILSEALLENKLALIGIGLNLNSSPSDFSSHLKLTTVLEHHKNEIPIPSFIDSFLSHFKINLDLFYKEGLAPFLNHLSQSLAWKNSMLQITEAENTPYKAKLLGLDQDGFLKIEVDSQTKKLMAGDICPL